MATPLLPSSTDVMGSQVCRANWKHDDEGRRVQPTVNPSTGSGQAATTTFVGPHYEVTGTQVTKYYTSISLSASFAGAQRIALRTPDGALKYVLGDHLGSTSLVTDSNGALVTETKYKAWGEVRYTTPNTTLSTRYTFTGQYSYVSDTATDLGNNGFGLMFYNARWYDSTTGRFAQADSIVPGGVQGLDRYAYVGNNPINYVDPSGHIYCTYDKDGLESCYQNDSGDNGGGIYGQPDYVDPNLLDKTLGGKTGISGSDLYETYLTLWKNHDAWYWQDGHFTIWDFIALILYKEANVVMNGGGYAAFQEAFARSFYTWCGAHTDVCRGGSDPASVLNFLSRYSDSAEALVKNPASALVPLKNWKGEIIRLSKAYPMINGLSNTNWQNGCVGDRPCHWGNFSLFSTDMAKMARKKPWFYYTLGGDNPLYIMTLCQSYYWWGGYWKKGGNAEFRSDYPNCER
jgi:RHS repeat-associated protein